MAGVSRWLRSTSSARSRRSSEESMSDGRAPGEGREEASFVRTCLRRSVGVGTTEFSREAGPAVGCWFACTTAGVVRTMLTPRKGRAPRTSTSQIRHCNIGSPDQLSCWIIMDLRDPKNQVEICELQPMGPRDKHKGAEPIVELVARGFFEATDTRCHNRLCVRSVEVTGCMFSLLCVRRQERFSEWPFRVSVFGRWSGHD